MYNSVNRQFVFRQSNGRIWNFFHDRKEGICYSLLKHKSTWSAAGSLVKNAAQPFYADMDADDRFHIIYQDYEGDIFYMLLENGQPVKIPVLKSKAPTTYDKCLHLLPFKRSVHFFYTLRHNEKTLLAHQILNEGKVSNPKVIDYVAGGSLPYTVVADRPEAIYAFYQASNDGVLKILSKRYTELQKGWGEYGEAVEGAGTCEYPRVLTDFKNALHLIFQRRSGEGYALVYRQKAGGRNLWSDETVIHTSSKPFNEASIACINETIVIFWVRTDVVFYSSSTDGGSAWSNPSRYNFYAGRQMYCMAYKSNFPGESDKISVRELPGSFINGLRLGFHQPPEEKSAALSAEALRDMIVESLKMLKTDVEELKEADSKLKENIGGLNRYMEDMKRDIDKFSIRLEMAEGAGTASRASGPKLEALKGEVSALKAELDLVKQQLENLKPDSL